MKNILRFLPVIFILAQLSITAATATAQEPAAQALQWHDVTQWGVEGRILPHQERERRWFDRLPKAAQATVTPSVWSLSRDSAGMMVRSKTDATAIHIHYRLLKSNLRCRICQPQG